MNDDNDSNVIDMEELMRKKAQIQASFGRFNNIFGKLKFLPFLLILVLLVFKMAYIYVEPNEYGIKISRMGFNRGVQKEVYGPGLHFVIPDAGDGDHAA